MFGYMHGGRVKPQAVGLWVISSAVAFTAGSVLRHEVGHVIPLAELKP